MGISLVDPSGSVTLRYPPAFGRKLLDSRSALYTKDIGVPSSSGNDCGDRIHDGIAHGYQRLSMNMSYFRLDGAELDLVTIRPGQSLSAGPWSTAN